MAEENKEHKHAEAPHKHEHKEESKPAAAHTHTEAKPTEKKKEKKVMHVKKEEAVANGKAMHMSKRQGMYICTFIKGKKIDDAINELQSVMKLKKAVPFKGEIPHRKGKGMMSGRYPVKASGLFITLLKGLKGNVITNGLDLDKTVIYYAAANWAFRPLRSGNRKGKRTHITLKAKETTNKNG